MQSASYEKSLVQFYILSCTVSVTDMLCKKYRVVLLIMGYIWVCWSHYPIVWCYIWTSQKKKQTFDMEDLVPYQP